MLHLTGPDPIKPLVVVNAAGLVVDGEGAQRHIDGVESDVDPQVRHHFLLGEGAVGGGDFRLRGVPGRPMLAN